MKQAYVNQIKIKENKKTDLMTLINNNHYLGFYADFFNNAGF